MGTKDTPAVIKTIKRMTGADKISYIGHSEGTTQIMAGASLMPDFYKDSLNVAVFMAPPASLKNAPNFFLHWQSEESHRNLLLDIMNKTHTWNLLPYNFVQSKVSTELCKLINGQFCNYVMNLVTGDDASIDYTERQDVYDSNSPSGASWRNYAHYGQLVDKKTESFTRWDYGSPEDN